MILTGQEIMKMDDQEVDMYSNWQMRLYHGVIQIKIQYHNLDSSV